MIILTYLLTAYRGAFPVEPSVAYAMVHEVLAEAAIIWAPAIVTLYRFTRRHAC